jgi:hypothetical protein
MATATTYWLWPRGAPKMGLSVEPDPAARGVTIGVTGTL